MELGEFQACEQQKGNAWRHKSGNVRATDQRLRIGLEQAQRRRFILFYVFLV